MHPAEAARSAGRVGGFAGSSTSRSYSGGGSSARSSGGYSSGSSYSSGSRSSGSYGGSRRYDSFSYGGSRGVGISSYGIMPAPLIAPPVVVSPYAGPTVVAPGAAATTFDAFDALLLMSLAFIAFSTVSSLASERSVGLLPWGSEDGEAGPLQLTKVQVGLLATARELKHDLDSIAEAADTSTSEGLQELLWQVVLALLRNPQYCVYASGGKKVLNGGHQLEREFNR